IRDFHVTGVQTCALPISPVDVSGSRPLQPSPVARYSGGALVADPQVSPQKGRQSPETSPVGSLHGECSPEPPSEFSAASLERERSEERRVGKECRAREWT